MSDIKKTALIVLIITFLLNTFTQYAYAANEYDHDELMTYEGYSQAMYESIVEQTTFISGQYADNQNYVRDSMNEVKNYADFWYNEYNDFTSSCYQSSAMNCLGEMAERGGAYVLTVGDWVKKLFDGFLESNSEEVEMDHLFEPNSYRLLNPYKYDLSSLDMGLSSVVMFTVTEEDSLRSAIRYSVGGIYFIGKIITYETSAERVSESERIMALFNKDVFTAMNTFNSLTGASIKIIDTSLNNSPVTNRPSPNSNLTNINDYIQNNQLQIPVPQIKPHLVCPDGTRISMNISGSTFLSVDGTVMMVNKDGTAEVNGSLCNLGWTKPTVEYDPQGQPVVTNPDGTKTDLTTGDTTGKTPGATDLEGCTGVLCGIGKLLDGVGSVVTAIGDLVKKLLDGLLGLFVPENLDFMSEEFTKITKKLNDKIAITETLKDAIKGVFGGGGGNPLANISINLPITNEPLTFGNVAFIEEGVPILRRVISAIVVLYTIAYVYRKITGRGGVMER